MTASEDFVGDVLSEDGITRLVGTHIQAPEDCEIHDATGMLLLPGGVDVHTHLDWDFGVARTVDTFATGTMAAAFGGTTTVVDFCNQGSASPLAALEEWHGRAAVSCVDVGAHLILNRVSDEVLTDVRTLAEREGVTSFKLFMAYPGTLMVDDASLFRAMRVAAEIGALVCVHAENGSVIQLLVEEALARGEAAPKYHATTRPAALEGEATSRAIALAAMTGCPTYFVHLSAAEALAVVASARAKETPVYAETCPHYLLLDEREYERPDFEAAKFVMTPPLRSPEHQAALWRGLRTGVLSAISTDHCPFCFAQEPYGPLYSKQQGRSDFSKIPNGAPGIETRLPLIFDAGVRTGQLSLNRFVNLVSTTPARLFGLYPRKGTIAPGSDADYVLLDPDAEWTVEASRHHSRVDYSLFEGRKVRGRVAKVFLRGELIVDGDEWRGREGAGKYLRRGSTLEPLQ